METCKPEDLEFLKLVKLLTGSLRNLETKKLKSLGNSKTKKLRKFKTLKLGIMETGKIKNLEAHNSGAKKMKIWRLWRIGKLKN